MNRTVDVATSLLSSILRFGGGLAASHPAARQPEKLLELYEFEGCPFCRKVREALTAFDLDALIYPCPHGGTRFRPEAVKKGGKSMFPYLVDPNTGTAMYESDDITRYLATTYGDGTVPLGLRLGPLTILGSSLSSAVRGRRGSRARKAKANDKPLELWSFDASPFCRLAREALCALELSYVLHNVGKGSTKWEAFMA
jgi:glutaredoxin